MVQSGSSSSWSQSSNLYDCKVPLNHYSSLTRLKRVTAWMLRFINSCRERRGGNPASSSGPLSVAEMTAAETLWLCNAQYHCFSIEIEALKKNRDLPRASCLRTLHPFLDSSGLLSQWSRAHLQVRVLPATSSHPSWPERPDEADRPIRAHLSAPCWSYPCQLLAE